MWLLIANRWFKTHSYNKNITRIFAPHVIPDIRCNMWHMRDSERDLLFDSGMGAINLRKHVTLVTEKLFCCVASNSHFHHASGHWESFGLEQMIEMINEYLVRTRQLAIRRRNNQAQSSPLSTRVIAHSSSRHQREARSGRSAVLSQMRALTSPISVSSVRSRYLPL